jgi:hypothetical protein
MRNVGTSRAHRVRNGIVGAAVVLASVVGVAPALAGADDTSQRDARPFVDVSDRSVALARAQAGAATSGPDTSRGLIFRRVAMDAVLADASANSARAGLLAIDLPAPDGSAMAFNVWKSAVMAPGLAAAFPEITTYAGQGIDDPAATIVFDVTPHGFHAQVLSPSGAWYINPATVGDDVVHESFFRSDRGSPQSAFIEGTLDEVEQLEQVDKANPVATRSGTELRTLRTAVSATGPYTALTGGTRALAQAAIVTAINRVSGMYVTEISTQLQLVAGNENLVFESKTGVGCPVVPQDTASTDKDCDPFVNGNVDINTNQAVVDDIIGNANYDLGHVFTTGSGVAGLGVVGATGQKARGTTGLSSIDDDRFYVDYVAHEMGHQLGGSHTFNGVNNACGGNASGDVTLRIEPGSGSTIQAYAGICGLDNLQRANNGQAGDGTNASDLYFHSRSFDQIITRLGQIVVGTTATNNSVPTANAGLDVTIPAQTPFFLTATGSDANDDALTYNFEQRDGGTLSALSAPEVATGPLFRSFPPRTSRSSFFPRLSEVAAGNTNQNAACVAPDGSQQKALCWSQYLVPTGTSRAMNFRATVRDNRAGGGGVNTDDTVVNVHNTGTPFKLTAPNGGQTLSGATTVTWTVGGTTGAPVSATHVSIRMSTDGGLTFPTELLADIPNDGSAALTLSNVNSNQARLMVHSGDFTNGSGFFDISNANFATTSFPATAPGAPTGVSGTAGNAQVVVSWVAPANTGGASITSYKVTAAPGAATCSTATLGCAVRGLTNGTPYTFTVTATNSIDTSAASAPSAVATPSSRATPPGFNSVNLARLLETRSGPGLKTIDRGFEGVGRLADGDIFELQVAGRGLIPVGSESASLNVVAVLADGPGFLTVYPCDQPRPGPAASVNYDGGDVRPNAVLTKLSATGTVCIYSLRATDLVVDANGAFT